MGTFYDNYVNLCNYIGKSPSAVALEVGLSKTAVSGWKNGRSNPTDATLRKIADYFGVSVTELVSEYKEKPTATNGELEEDLQELIALLNGMSDEKLQMMVNYARFLASQE